MIAELRAEALAQYERGECLTTDQMREALKEARVKWEKRR
jgi:hypothetical protein